MPVTETSAITVGEYASALGRALRAVGSATVEGEVQRPRDSAGGMLWFSLTDGENVLSCKVFRGQLRNLEHVPRHGDLVRVDVERPDLYARSGKLDLIVGQVRLAGEGELLRARRELVARLAREGLCDPARRRPLPAFSRAVGLIAGRGSDGMSDVVRALRDRWPGVHVVAHPCTVQGKAAPRALVDALARLADHPLVDAVILARGGGSVQDLACFDDEGLCRALFACDVPVVCAIGHTDNNPVCNHVTWSAFTPSRSAELVVPCRREVERTLTAARERLGQAVARLDTIVERTEHAGMRCDPGASVERRAKTVHEQAAAVDAFGRAATVTRARGIGAARETISSAPYRAERELAAARERLLRLSPALDAAGVGLDGRARAVIERVERVRAGTLRQLDDHSRDYGRAVRRLGREAHVGVGRRSARARELVEREASPVGERAHRRLADARRAASEAAALVLARDFRRRGWLLASSLDDRPIRSAADLRRGAGVRLTLADGHAEATVDHIDLNRKGRRAP